MLGDVYAELRAIPALAPVSQVEAIEPMAKALDRLAGRPPQSRQ